MNIKWYCFLKMSFDVTCEVLLAKNQKVFKGGKIRNDDETEYLKKRFLLKRHLY